MKSADLRALDALLRRPGATEASFDLELGKHFGDDPRALCVSSEGSQAYFLSDYGHLQLPGDLTKEEPAYWATLASMAGLSPGAVEHLGTPLPHDDFSDQPNVQVLALLALFQARSMLMLAMPGAFEDSRDRAEGLDVSDSRMEGVRLAAADRLHALLMDFPVLAHPKFVWCFQPKGAREGFLATAAPLLHRFVASRLWSLPVMSDKHPEALRRAWARHPALTAALTTKGPSLRGREDHCGAGVVPFTCPVVDFSDAQMNGVSMLRLERFRREPAPADFPDDAPVTQVRIGDRDELVDASARDFAAMWQRDVVHWGHDGQVALDPMYDAFRAEVALATDKVKATYATEALSQVGRLLTKSVNGGRGSVHSASRVHHLVGELVVCGLAPSHQDAARRVAGALLAPADDEDVGTAMSKVDPDTAQATLRVLTHYGARPEEMQGELAKGGVPTHQAKSFIEACNALVAEASMSTIIAGARAAAVAGADAPVSTPRRAAL